MNKDFEIKFKQLLSDYSPTKAEILKVYNLTMKATQIWGESCKSCKKNHVTHFSDSKLISYIFCQVCRSGELSIKAKIRAKKTIKSYDQSSLDRGHYIRFIHKNGNEDNMQLNIDHPQELEVRSGDEISLDIPFYLTCEDVVSNILRKKKISNFFELVRKTEELDFEISKKLKKKSLFNIFSRNGHVEITVEKEFNSLCENYSMRNGEINEAQYYLDLVGQIKEMLLDSAIANDSLLIMYLKRNTGLNFELFRTRLKNTTTNKSYTLKVKDIRDNDLLVDARKLISRKF